MIKIDDNLPQHIAIVPDGNRRWAKTKNLHPWLGHRAGAKNFEKSLEVMRDLNLPCITFWAMSEDNYKKRTKLEVKYLQEIFRSYFLRLIKRQDIYNLKVKVNIFGLWRDILPQRIKKPMEEVIKATKNHNERYLNFLIGYSGKTEMLQAIKSITRQAKIKKNLKITSELVKNNLWTKELPPVDLVIRTGCAADPHWSAGLMMWDVAEAQLHFSKILYPDFDSQELIKVINGFKKRERRFGQ